MSLTSASFSDAVLTGGYIGTDGSSSASDWSANVYSVVAFNQYLDAASAESVISQILSGGLCSLPYDIRPPPPPSTPTPTAPPPPTLSGTVLLCTLEY